MSPSFATLALISAMTVAAAAAATAQPVHVVDATGSGAAFTTIQPAVDAANPGDTVLVKQGIYVGATVSKFVQLIADGPGVMLTSSIVIDGILAPEFVRLSGFEISSPRWTTADPFVVVQNCSGPVWIEDCQLVGHQARGNGAAVLVDSSTAVTIQRCRMWVSTGTGNPGLRSLFSTVHVFDSEMIGSDAALLSMGCLFSTGGAGIYAVDGVLHLHRSTARGGAGINFSGGPGLFTLGPTQVIERGSTFVGGAGGTCGLAIPGPPINLFAGGMLQTLAGMPLTLTMARVVRELGPVDYAIHGPPGAAVALCFALTPAPMHLPWLEVSLLLDSAFVAVPLGTIPATGSRIVTTLAPVLGPGVDEQTVYVQALAIDSSSRVISGSGQAITVLGASF